MHIINIDTTEKMADWVECRTCGNDPEYRKSCSNPDCEDGFVLIIRM